MVSHQALPFFLWCRVVSSDRHIVKIWDINTGAGYTSIEPTEGEVNDVCLWPKSGVGKLRASRLGAVVPISQQNHAW